MGVFEQFLEANEFITVIDFSTRHRTYAGLGQRFSQEEWMNTNSFKNFREGYEGPAKPYALDISQLSRGCPDLDILVILGGLLVGQSDQQYLLGQRYAGR